MISQIWQQKPAKRLIGMMNKDDFNQVFLGLKIEFISNFLSGCEFLV